MTDDGDDAGFDDLVADVCTASVKDDVSEREAARDLLEWVAENGDVPKREEAIEAIANSTDFNKSAAQDWYKEINSEKSMAMLDVQDIIEIEPWDPDEDNIYQFHVIANGDEHTFKVSSGELTSQNAMQKKILEVCHVKVTFDDWDQTLNEWLDKATMDKKKEEPLTPAHSIANKVVRDIGSAEATFDYETLKQSPQKVYLHNWEQEEQPDEPPQIWVRSEMIDQTLEASNAEVTKQKLRPILDGVMAGPVQSLRSDGTGFTSAWRFDAEKLGETEQVDLADLEAVAEKDSDGPGDAY